MFFFVVVSLAFAGGAEGAKNPVKEETSLMFRTNDQVTVNWDANPPTISFSTTNAVRGTDFTRPFAIPSPKAFKPDMWKYHMPQNLSVLYTDVILAAQTRTIYGYTETKETECLYRSHVVKRDVEGYKENGLAIVKTIVYEIETLDDNACHKKGTFSLLK
jgi:hypothetical protein